MTTKITLFQLIIAFLVVSNCGAQTVTHEKHLGGLFSRTEITPIGKLTTHPGKYFNKDVKVEGIIASACTDDGCFIEIVAEEGGGEGILVNFRDLAYIFPTDCAGHTVVVEGMFYQKIYPPTRVLHWQEHSFRKEKHVPEFSLIKRITAKAVDIGQTMVAIPKPTDILDAPVDRIDLNTMEFEAEGFGTGKKTLKPSEITSEHSTGNHRELIFCLQGAITVRKSDKPPVTLMAGEMTYIPPATKHEIKNLADTPATYIFVFSQQPETQTKKPHDD